MVSLYELNKEIIALLDKREQSQAEDIERADGNISFDFQLEMAKLSDQFEVKVENICKVVREYETDNDKVDSEIKRLQAIKQRNTKKTEKLENYLSRALQSQWVEKLETSLFKLSFRKSSSLEIVDQSQIPEKYRQETVVVSYDKNIIKAAIKEGETIPGVQMIDKQNLQIK